MIPIVRTLKEVVTTRKQPRLALGETHASHHIIWPWDIDLWMELNNGRTLTLFDLGRVGMFVRSAFLPVARERGWAGTVAGSSVRHRHRLRMFDRVEMRSRYNGWDARFFYSEQSLWRGETCCSHGLLRLAVTGKDGLVPPQDVVEALGYGDETGDLPDWVAAWVEAEALRPWPPMEALQTGNPAG